MRVGGGATRVVQPPALVRFTVFISWFAASVLLATTSRWSGAAGPALAPDFSRYLEGKYLFELNCVVCHGVRGDGKGELAPMLTPRPRSFREGVFMFRTTPPGKLPIEDDLRHTIRTGLSGTAMGMCTQLSEDDVTNVIEYVKFFSRRWRKAENYAAPLAFPEAPAWVADAGQKVAHAVKGGVLFQANSASCHGLEWHGDGQF